jgi:hypothetical protein
MHMPGTRTTRRSFAIFPPALVVLAMLMQAPLPASAGTNPILTFHTSIGHCWYGQGPASASVNVTWTDAAGHVKASFIAMSDGSGYYYPPEADCTASPVAVLDRIHADAGSFSRTFKVRNLTISLNRSTKVASGHAPPNATITVNVWHQELGGFGQPYPNCSTSVTADSAGHYAKNVKNLPNDGVNCTGTFNPVGGDGADVYWSEPAGDSVEHETTAPYLLLTLGKAQAQGAAKAGQSVTIHLRNASGTLKGTAHDTGDLVGLFSGQIRNRSGSPAMVKSGDHVDGDWAGAVAFVVPTLKITWNTALNTVRGRCMPHVIYALILVYSGGTYAGEDKTDSLGRTKPLNPGEALASGDKATLICARPPGDQLERISVLP